MMNQLKFSSLNLNSSLLKVIEDLGFEYLSPIQEKAIPLMLQDKSVMGLAPTGSGKTLAFALPILNDLKDDGHVQAVIISPTVALLKQIKDVFSAFLDRLNFKQDAIKAIYSNKDFNHSQPDILLITPQLYKTALSHYPINELKRVIIDEGDMVAFDGFSDTLKSLKKQIELHQVSFFSASLNVQDIRRIKSTFCIDKIVDVRDKITNKTVRHHLINIRENTKVDALKIFLKEKKPFKCIAFVSTKEELAKITEQLKIEKIHHLSITGSMDKRDISKTIEAFKQDDENLLIATDYVSRGLDIDNVDVIISLDLPRDLQYYFHRAGRSGRFDSDGDSYVFFTQDDEDGIKKVKELIKRGVDFDNYSISKDSLKKNKDPYQFRNLGKKDRADSEVVQKQIRHAVNQTKTNKVKPGYKKKVKKAVELVKFKHRRKVVLTNIAKNGGNVRDFHYDDNKRSKRK